MAREFVQAMDTERYAESIDHAAAPQLNENSLNGDSVPCRVPCNVSPRLNVSGRVVIDGVYRVLLAWQEAKDQRKCVYNMLGWSISEANWDYFLFSTNIRKMTRAQMEQEQQRRRKKSCLKWNDSVPGTVVVVVRRMEEGCVRNFHSSYFIFFYLPFRFSRINDVSVLCCLHTDLHSAHTYHHMLCATV